MGPNPLFNFYSSSDLHNADQVIANIDQGGLTLPDRDYYMKDDEKMKEIRQHLMRICRRQCSCWRGRLARIQAGDVGADCVAIETALAKARWMARQRREPENRDHKMSARTRRCARTELSSRPVLPGMSNAPSIQRS